MKEIEEEHGPRPRDAARTRDAIRHAARTLFARKGYTTTGVREIAGVAGVNSALVCRYFGSKEGLLRSVLEDLLNVETILDGDRTQFGDRAAAMLLKTDSIANPVAIMMLAMADPEARALCGAMVQDNVIRPLAEWLGGEDAADRAAQLNILWTGFIAQRHLTPLSQLSDANVAPTQHWIAHLSQMLADAGTPVFKADR